MGDFKPWFMGKNPCFITLWFSTFVICHPFVSSNLVNLFNDLLGGWAVMAAGGWAVIAFGSGVAGLSVLCPHPHSTHDPMLALPVLFSSRACSLCPSCILSTVCSSLNPRFWLFWVPHAQNWGGVFGLTQVSTLQFRVLHVGGSFSRGKLLSVGLSRTRNSWLYPHGFSSADSPIVRPYLSSRAEERAVFPRFCWLWSPTAFWAAGYLW